MAQNRGKQFENIIRQSFEKVDGVSIDRLHDQTSGYLGSSNICDFIVYRKPYEYYIECKSIHGNTFPLSNISNNQYRGLSEKAKIKGVVAGIIVWWVDKDVTRFIPIKTIQVMKEHNFKSYRYDTDVHQGERSYIIKGKKRRVFFDYDMKYFLDTMEERNRR